MGRGPETSSPWRNLLARPTVTEVASPSLPGGVICSCYCLPATFFESGSSGFGGSAEASSGETVTGALLDEACVFPISVAHLRIHNHGELQLGSLHLWHREVSAPWADGASVFYARHSTAQHSVMPVSCLPARMYIHGRETWGRHRRRLGSGTRSRGCETGDGTAGPEDGVMRCHSGCGARIVGGVKRGVCRGGGNRKRRGGEERRGRGGEERRRGRGRRLYSRI